jgi:hypothetical protein
MNARLLRHPSAFLPILMSAAALTLVLAHVARVGTARQADEGTEAHLFQLLMAAQLPIIAWSALRGFARAPRGATVVLLAQTAAAAAALLVLWWFESH